MEQHQIEIEHPATTAQPGKADLPQDNSMAGGSQAWGDQTLLLHQPLSLVVIRAVLLGLFLLLTLLLFREALIGLASVYPSLGGDNPGSRLAILIALLYSLYILGEYWRWRSIIYEFSNERMVVYGGILRKRAKSYGSLGSAIRQFNVGQNILFKLLNVAQLTVGIELLGGLNMLIPEADANIPKITELIKPTIIVDEPGFKLK